MAGVTARDTVRTPALILDLDVLDRNIATMAGLAKAMNVGLRPHSKSHKCVEIAQRLSRAGVNGACCATIDEAEAMALGGIGGILVTSPLVTSDQLQRLGRLLARGADVAAVADNPRNADAYGHLARAANRQMEVIVEFDFGMGRTGCVEIQDAVALAQHIKANPSLRFRGVQAYWGQLQQVTPMAERQRQAEAQHSQLRAVIGALTGAGLKPEVVSGAGTGTHAIDGKSGLFTELQAGSFLFMDSCYGPSLASGAVNPFTASLFVAASVVSANVAGRVIVNAGYKAFATDSGRPEPRRGAPAGATYRFMGDEHGAVEFTGAPPALGATIEFLTSHCDPTVNLHAAYQVVRGDEIVDVWPIRARY